MNLLWMDVETKGLNPDVHCIIDICFVETDREGRELKRFTSKVHPGDNWKKHAEARAMEVNSYNEEEWKEAPAAFEIEAKLIEHFGTDAGKGELLLPAGWNVKFDLAFVKSHFNLWDDKSRKRIKFHHHSLDLLSLGWNYIRKNDRVYLGDLCERFGVAHNNQHTAEGDVNAYIACYKKLIF